VRNVQRHLRFEGQGRVAAREHEPQLIVVETQLVTLVHWEIEDVALGRHERAQFILLAECCRAPTDLIDRLIACRSNQPRARIFRHAFLGPLKQSTFPSGGRCVFGNIEISQNTDERRQGRRALIRADPFYDCPCVLHKLRTKASLFGAQAVRGLGRG